ncbi:hypothetical protein QBC34DRAFT_474695 [Podospora aff. communis PSN243]|uniref:C2H2-type domain-containing protein n=1 Tax=Podospora aff. communis PSN243 TaxID=3040156 RepID=A0AAV9G7D7_9PEZI|nr:hypothetical protein QBC34DRAFT_474695 [Podospora aff. communis PSN243]
MVRGPFPSWSVYRNPYHTSPRTMTDATKSPSHAVGREARYNAIEEQLRKLDREAREACYQLLVLLVQSRDKATNLSVEWDHISHELLPQDRKEVSSILLGTGGVFFHDDNILFALGFNYNKANNVYNVSVDFDADPDSSCYRKCRHDSNQSRQEETSPFLAIPSPNTATNLQAPKTPKPYSRTSDAPQRSSPLSSPTIQYTHTDAETPELRSPSFSPWQPARPKRQSSPPASQLKRRRVAGKGSDKIICRECEPPRTLNRHYFKTHKRLEHGEDRGKAYMCPVKLSGSVCNKATKAIQNFRSHLMAAHKMKREDANELSRNLEKVFVEGM